MFKIIINFIIRDNVVYYAPMLDLYVRLYDKQQVNSNAF
jgi:hypothetical protein